MRSAIRVAALGCVMALGALALPSASLAGAAPVTCDQRVEQMPPHRHLDYPMAVNDDGLVVARTDFHDQLMAWLPDGTVAKVQAPHHRFALDVEDVSNSGIIAAQAPRGGVHAPRAFLGGSVQPRWLKPRSNRQHWTIAYSVLDDGTAFGAERGARSRAAVWGPSQTRPTLLPTPAGYEGAEARDVDNRGRIVGLATRTHSNRPLALVRWSPTGVSRVLTTLPEAFGIEDMSGPYVVGYFPLPKAGVGAFIAGPNGISRVRPPDGYHKLAFVGVNTSKQAVGVLQHKGTRTGATYHHGIITTLPGPPNRRSTQALAVSESGTIAGTTDNHAIRWFCELP